MSKDLYDLTDEELEQEFYKAKAEVEGNLEVTNSESVVENEDIHEDEYLKEEPTTDNNSNDNIEDDENTIEYNDKKDELQQSTETAIPTLHKVKAHGKEYDFSTEELIQLASKGLDYTKKMQTISPFRKMISAIEENDISENDINMLIDLKNGKKEALVSIAKKFDTDVYDLPEAEGYIPTSYGKDEKTIALNETVDRLKIDTEFAHTQQVVNSLDNVSKNFILSNPDMLEGLHIDIKEGVFDKVLPNAEKMAAIDGYNKPFLDYYIKAGSEFYANANQSNNTPAKPDNTSSKKSASLPTQRADKKTMINYLDEDNDEEFNKWYNRTMSKY